MAHKWELEPWMIRQGVPDVNPTICARCKKPHNRISAFCSHRCRRAWNCMKRRQNLKAKKAATIEELG